MAQRGAMLPPTIKQEATAHLAAMMSPPARAPAAPTAPAGVRVKRELPVGAQDLADLALPPPKRPRAAEAGAAAPSLPPPAVVAQRKAVAQPSSRYVGVSWFKPQRRWRAEIRHEGRNQSLGYFAEEEAAARAFDEAARRLRGDRAHGSGRRLNFPTESETAAADESVV